MLSAASTTDFDVTLDPSLERDAGCSACVTVFHFNFETHPFLAIPFETLQIFGIHRRCQCAGIQLDFHRDFFRKQQPLLNPAKYPGWIRTCGITQCKNYQDQCASSYPSN
uniref:Uncharacterized protein n=1 Tax=Pseudomonas putida TaxID=303 RepID=Q8VMK2_PSEPU|nr:hypothetical protein [Pseudomonas putida]